MLQGNTTTIKIYPRGPGFGNQTGGKLLHYAFDPGGNSRVQVFCLHLKPQRRKEGKELLLHNFEINFSLKQRMLNGTISLYMLYAWIQTKINLKQIQKAKLFAL